MLWTLMRVPMGRSRTASCTKTRLCLRSVFTQTQVLKTLFSLLLTLIHRTDWCTCYLLLVPVCLSATVPQALSCSPLKLSNSLWLINHDSDANISHKLLFMLCDFCFAFICCFTLSCSYISIYPSCSFCCTARWPLVCLIHFPMCLVCAGVMVTARKFDRERQREYAVTVTATDQAGDPLIGICQLNIFILDENDNSPKFENIRYECK